MRGPARCAVALALAGCAETGMPLRETVAVPASRFAAVQGQADLVLRAYVEDEAGLTREVSGAACEVRSILFAAEVQTPGRLVFPSFGPQSPTLEIACQAGELSGTAVQGVVSQWVRMPGAWPGPYGYGGWGGPWGGPWGDPWGGWSGPSYVTFVYPDVAVRLR